MGKGVDSSDESEDNQSVETLRYQDLDSTEVKMGSDIDAELASVCKQIWGKDIFYMDYFSRKSYTTMARQRNLATATVNLENHNNHSNKNKKSYKTRHTYI